MNDTAAPAKNPLELWDGPTGQAWVDNQELLNHLLQPFEDLLVDTPAATGAAQVLDIGCGTGSVARAITQRLGPDGRCIGVDISRPMTAAAAAKTTDPRLSFVCADAQTYPFAPAGIDLFVSRFGVMFFDDPVRAFTNLRHSARADARLCAIAWRGAADNPFMTTAERAAAPLLPELPARKPDAPGQFAFADRARVQGILEDSGWRGIDIRAVDFECRFPEPALRLYLSRLGPVGRVLQEIDAARRERIIDVLRAAFEPYVRGAEVRFSAACWQILARAP